MSDRPTGPHIDAAGVFHHGPDAETVDLASAPPLDLAALRDRAPDIVQVRRELPRLRQLLVTAHLIEHLGPDHPDARAAATGEPIPSAESLRRRIAELEAQAPWA